MNGEKKDCKQITHILSVNISVLGPNKTYFVICVTAQTYASPVSEAPYNKFQ